MTALPEPAVAPGWAAQPRAGLSGALIGRERELATVAAAAATPPSLAIIEGEAGIGKTRLVRELREHPSLAGRRLVVGGCRLIREPFPLGPVLEAVRAMRDALRPESLSPVTGALRPLLPELIDVLPPSPEQAPNSDAGRHRVFRALREVLGTAGPATVVLEDLHWADELTVDFLRYLVGDLPEQLSLVLTMRAEGVDPAARALATRAPLAVARAHASLQPLDAAQTGELVASLLATDRVSAEFAAYLRERTGGLPFAIEEVTALLQERGEVTLRGRAWSRRALAELTVPAAVRDHVLERVSLLPVAARQLLEVVAVLQSPAPEELVAEVAELPRREVAALLSQAIEAGLLVDDGAAVGFRHVLAAQAVYDGLPGPRRRELHQRAAAALRGADAEALGQLALHLRRAGRLTEWATVAVRAADQASALGHFDEATRLLEDVLREAPVDPADFPRLAVKLGWAARATLRAPEVADLLAKALEQGPPRAVATELKMFLATLGDERDLDWREHRERFAEVAAAAADRPDLQAWAMVAMEMRNAPQTPYDERHRWLTQVLERIAAVDDPDFVVFLLGKVGLAMVAMGDPRWRQVLAEVEARTGGVPAQWGQATAYQAICELAVYAGHHREAERLRQTIRRVDWLVPEEKLAVLTGATAALVDYCQGGWDGLADTVRDLLDGLNQRRAGEKLKLIAGGLALARGELADAERWLTRMSEGLAHGDGSDCIPMAATARIRVALARSDLAAAVTVAEEYVAFQSGSMVWPAVYRLVPWLAEALSLAGQPERARGLVEGYAAQLRGRDAPLEPAALAFADGFIRTAGGDQAGAAAAFLAAADHYEQLGCPYEAAQAWEAAARALAEAGQPAEVAPPLRAAMATFERLGAGHDLARALQAARQYGVSVPARHRGGHQGYGDQLSPRERQVAALAATGRTNREIAEQLFLSVETVKKHLYAAMRKLRVPTRTALARVLPRDGEHYPGEAGTSG